MIPFDPPEAASVELVSRKQTLYTPAETEAMVPFLTCLKPEGVQLIITTSKKACRDDDNCVQKLDTVMDTVERLDGIAEKIIGGLAPDLAN